MSLQAVNVTNEKFPNAWKHFSVITIVCNCKRRVFVTWMCDWRKKKKIRDGNEHGNDHFASVDRITPSHLSITQHVAVNMAAKHLQHSNELNNKGSIVNTNKCTRHQGLNNN